MDIRPAQSGAAPVRKSLGKLPTADSGAPQDQVAAASPQDAAIAVIQQMAEARLKLGQQLIGEIIEPAPGEFKAVTEATTDKRHEIAVALAAQAEGTQTPGEVSVATSNYYILASETQTLVQTAIQAEARADFQAKAGGTPNREALVQEELGYLVQANIYQGQIPLEELQKMVPSTPPEGEKALSAGTLVESIRQHVPTEFSKQVEELAQQNPLISTFREKPELLRQFAGALTQNNEAAFAMQQGCIGYFSVLTQIAQQDAQAIAVLQQSQAGGQG